MPTEPPRSDARIEVTIENDPRLMTGVSAVVSHAGHFAGLSAGAQTALASAVTDACKETFPLLNGRDSSLKLIVDHFHDRVEVAIEHSGEPLPTAGLDSFCAGAARSGSSALSAALLSTHVDRVKYETRDGRSRTILIKYRAGAVSKEAS